MPFAVNYDNMMHKDARSRTCGQNFSMPNFSIQYKIPIFARNLYNRYYTFTTRTMKRNRTIFIITAMLLTAIAGNAQTSSFFTHTVSKGQTLYSISKMYGTTVDEIVKHNPGSAAKLSIGQKLSIPQKSAGPEQPSSTGKENNGAKYHTIKSGETLYRLGKMYGLTPQQICDANPGLSISNFRAGEVVLIPVKNESETPDKKTIEEKEPLTIVGTHKVKKKEKIEDICAKYGITKEELIEANHGLNPDKLKKGTKLNIPAPRKKAEKESHVKEIELTDRELFIKVEEYKDSIKAISKPDDGMLRVAVILPFLLDSYAPSEQGRMVEYYQGFLMAVKELKEKGYSFEINTYDSGHKNNSLKPLLSSGELDDMDLIIGALYSEHNKELAKFAKRKEIPLVIPFTSKEDDIFRNPMVYIVNTMQSYIIPEVATNFVNRFPNANVVFVEDTIKSNKQEFISGLTYELDKNGIPHTTVPMVSITGEERALPALKELMKEDRENFIIPTSSSARTLSSLLPTLVQSNIIDSIGVPEYKLFGYPEWQIHAKDMREQLYEVDTYFYATFYSHYSLPDVTRFQNRYIKMYNRNIQNIYPRYGMLGYDTGYFFLLAASKYGKELPERINELEFSPVQTGFKFERVNNWGGLINKKLYFIHYTRDYNIEKIDFDK